MAKHGKFPFQTTHVGSVVDGPQQQEPRRLLFVVLVRFENQFTPVPPIDVECALHHIATLVQSFDALNESGWEILVHHCLKIVKGVVTSNPTASRDYGGDDPFLFVK